MILTEDEAKKKWCPMVRYSVGVLEKSSCNASLDDRNPEYSKCLASDCMMWQQGQHYYSELSGVYCTSEKCVTGCEHEKGYCGLGGKP